MRGAVSGLMNEVTTSLPKLPPVDMVREIVGGLACGHVDGYKFLEIAPWTRYLS